MKQGVIVLMIITAILIVWECLDGRVNMRVSETHTSGSLSDIAESVTAIPLQYSGKHSFDKARNIRIVGNNLFLIADQTLFHFYIDGRLIGQITNPDSISVATYVVDKSNSQLIVLGNTNTIHYYSLDGELKESREFKSDSSIHYLKAIEMYDGYIWTAESLLRTDSATNQKYLEEQLVKYDSSFNKIEEHPLVAASLPGKPVIPSFAGMEIGVDEKDGEVYACSSPFLPDYLLRDSLILRDSKAGFLRNDAQNGRQNVYPFRLGSRFWLASYSDKERQNYIFCFDHKSSNSWLVESLDDNFYKTGAVSKLQTMDIFSNSYCFCKSGEDLKKSFPKQANSDSTVVFVVRMKA